MRLVIFCFIFSCFYIQAQVPFLIQGRPTEIEVTSYWSDKILNLQKSGDEKEVGFASQVTIDPLVSVTAFKVGNRIFLPKKRDKIQFQNFSYTVSEESPTENYEIFYNSQGLLYVPTEIADALSFKFEDGQFKRLPETRVEDENGYQFSFSPYNQGAKLALAIKFDLIIAGKTYSFFEFSKQRGGIERQFDVLLKASEETLILVNGNSRVDKEFYEKTYKNSEIYYEKLKSFSAHAHAVGLAELIGGVDFFQNQKGVNFVSANIYLDEGPFFQPYKIFNLNNKKIAVTSVIDQKTQRRLNKYYQSPFIIKDPIKSLKTTIKELGNEIDFLIVMLPEKTNMIEDYKKIKSVDMLVWDKKEDPEYINFEQQVSFPFQNIEYRKTMLDIKTSKVKASRGEIVFSDSLTIKNQNIHLVDSLIYRGFEGHHFYEELSNFQHQDSLIPKASQVSSLKISYSQDDINKLLCDSMLEKFQTDLCILSAREAGFNPPDGLSELIIKRWFRKRYLVKTDIIGSDFKKLLKTLEQKSELRSFMIKGFYNDLIRGTPIIDNQVYSIITTSEFFKRIEELGSSKMLLNKQTKLEGNKIRLISQFFIESLKEQNKDKKVNERANEIRKTISRQKDKKRGKWRAEIKKIDLNYSQRSSREVDPNFNARDNRVFTNDQIRFQIEANSSVYYQYGLYTAETGEEIQFSKEKIENQTSSVSNIISDSIFLFSKHSFFWTQNQLGDISPYLQLGYKTQFERTNSDRQHLWTLDLGMKFENTAWYDLFQFGPFAEIDNSGENQTPGRYGGGVSFRYRLSKPLFKDKMSLELESDYSYYYRRSNPNLDNIEQTWDSRIGLLTRLFEDVSFGPFIQYFYFHSINGDTSGGFLTTGVQFLYRGNWSL